MEAAQPPDAAESRVFIPNKHGEKLVGILHQTGSKRLVILCHGFGSSKDHIINVNLSTALAKIGLDTFRFDFSGNGESEGRFQYGYWREVDDLHSVISHFHVNKYDIVAIIGHSKGGTGVILYASLYDDVDFVINLSGRFDVRQGIENFLGKDYMDKIKMEGYIDLPVKGGHYRVTEEVLIDRLKTDVPAASRSIRKECRVVTVHGAKDELVPVEDAYEFDKAIPNHQLYIINDANHVYTEHQEELVSVVVDVFVSNQVARTSSGVP